MFRRPVGHAEEGEEVRTEGGWEKELSKAFSPGRWVREGRLGRGAGKASSPGLALQARRGGGGGWEQELGKLLLPAVGCERLSKSTLSVFFLFPPPTPRRHYFHYFDYYIGKLQCTQTQLASTARVPDPKGGGFSRTSSHQLGGRDVEAAQRSGPRPA